LLQQETVEAAMVTTGTLNMYKAPVKSPPPTYQDSDFFMLNALPVTQPTVSEHGWNKNTTDTVQIRAGRKNNHFLK